MELCEVSTKLSLLAQNRPTGYDKGRVNLGPFSFLRGFPRAGFVPYPRFPITLSLSKDLGLCWNRWRAARLELLVIISGRPG